MKKLYIVALLFIVSNKTFAQEKISDTAGLSHNLDKISLKYLGYNLSQPFNNLVQSVIDNPEIRVDTIIIHTDTSAFYIRVITKHLTLLKLLRIL